MWRDLNIFKFEIDLGSVVDVRGNRYRILQLSVFVLLDASTI